MRTSKMLEIDMRRIIERKLVSLGLSQQDIATALNLDTSSVRKDLAKIGEVEMVFDTTGMTVSEHRDFAFHHAFLEYLRVNSLIGHTMKKFKVIAEADRQLASALDVYLDTRRIMGIVDGLISVIGAMTNPVDPPEYQPYRRLLLAIFNKEPQKITRGKLLTEFYFHVCSSSVLVTRDRLPTELAVWAFDYYRHNTRIPLGETVKRVVKQVISTLPDKGKYLIELRFGLWVGFPGKDLTLDQMAEILGTNRERVRQLEAKALLQLRMPERARQLRVFLESPFDFTQRKLSEMFTPSPPSIIDEVVR